MTLQELGVNASSGVTVSDAVATLLGMLLAGLMVGLIARLTR